MSSVEKKFFVSYVSYVLVLVLITPKSLPALILRVLESLVNSKTVHKLTTQREDTNRVATSLLTLEVTRHMDRPSEWPHR